MTELPQPSEDKLTLNTLQLAIYKETEVHISRIVDFLSENMEDGDVSLMIKRGNRAVGMQAFTPKIAKNIEGLKSLMTGLAMRRVAGEMMEWKGPKEIYIKSMMEYYLSNVNALEAEGERAIRSLDKFCDWIKTTVATERDLIKNVHQHEK